MHLNEIVKREVDDSTHYFPDLVQGPTYLGVALAGEVGEVCNVIKKHARGSITDNDLHTRLYDELPDILIYLVMMAGFLEIDLEEAYLYKKEYNNARYLPATEA